MQLHGAFTLQHKEEMLHSARRQEAAEKPEHALNRIIDIAEDTDGITINTTATCRGASARRSSAPFTARSKRISRRTGISFG